MIRIRVALCAALLGVAFASHAEAQSDVIRGRVTGPDSLPLQNVVVTATTISGNVNRTARTDKNGRYTITFPGGDGDYMLTIAALGYAVKRFEVKRVADEDILHIVGVALHQVAGTRDEGDEAPIPGDRGGVTSVLSVGEPPARSRAMKRKWSGCARTYWT